MVACRAGRGRCCIGDVTSRACWASEMAYHVRWRWIPPTLRSELLRGGCRRLGTVEGQRHGIERGLVGVFAATGWER